MNKSEIVDVLESIATLLELKGENPFKIRAYQNGARTLETLEEDLATLIEEERLGSVKGIGDALVQKIESLYHTGELEFYKKLKDSIPSGLLDLLEIPGLGGKKIKKLHDELGIESINQLQAAAEDGRIADLKGFGKKTAENLLRGIENRKAYSARHLWWKVEAATIPILEKLRNCSAVQKVEAAGSFRRRRETVGDLDFIVASEYPEPVMDCFTSMEHVREITARGKTKSSVRLEGGLQADLRVVPPAQYPFALHHFTGSKDHNVKMRQRALQRGLTLSEWGLNPSDDKDRSLPAPPEIDSERDLFAALGLAYLPPELREGYDEIEVAEKEDPPRLVEYADLKGVFHNHTTASDGRASLEEMVRAASDRGWEYLGIADHSKASFQANGLDEERLLSQIRAIRKLNDSGKFQCHVFAGCEVDILPDGSLDFEDDLLKELDYSVISIHSSFNLSEADQTRRLIKAIENPHSTIVGHLTGRLLLKREPYALNINKVIDAAAANQSAIEINANPQRLDMDWRHWKRAAEKGVLCIINPDAHTTDGLDFTRAGIHIARKGWLTKEHVINSRSTDDIRSYLGLS